MITRDLIGTNLLITQRKNASFNLDTILLSAFVNIKKKTKHIVDIGTGNGAILLYLSTKVSNDVLLTGIEIMENKAKEAINNVNLNNLSNKINIINKDVNEITDINNVCIVVSNPPYFKIDHNRVNDDYERIVQRHELTLNLDQLFENSNIMLKDKGELYLVHKPDRLEDLIITASKYNFNLKELKFIYPYSNKSPNHILCKFVKGSKKGLKVLKPLILYKDRHKMTNDLIKLYNENSL